MIVCWNFDLLPRWALALLAARELFMLVLVRCGAAPRRRREGQLARAAPASGRCFSALFFAHGGVDWLAEACLYVGLVLVLGATVQYVRDGLRQSREQRPSS